MNLMCGWLVCCSLAPVAGAAGGDEVVVVYNSRVPASKAVAEHYAAARQVPAKADFRLCADDQ